MSLIKAINRGNIEELRKIVGEPHSLEELDNAIKRATEKRKFAFMDTSNTLNEKEYNEIIKLMKNNKNALILGPKVNKDVLNEINKFFGGKKSRKYRKSKSKKNKTKKSKRTYKRKPRN